MLEFESTLLLTVPSASLLSFLIFTLLTCKVWTMITVEGTLMTPSHPQICPCFNPPEPVSVLCYLMNESLQMWLKTCTLRQEIILDYSSGPILIAQALKSKKLFLAEIRKMTDEAEKVWNVWEMHPNVAGFHGGKRPWAKDWSSL